MSRGMRLMARPPVSTAAMTSTRIVIGRRSAKATKFIEPSPLCNRRSNALFSSNQPEHARCSLDNIGGNGAARKVKNCQVRPHKGGQKGSVAWRCRRGASPCQTAFYRPVFLSSPDVAPIGVLRHRLSVELAYGGDIGFAGR